MSLIKLVEEVDATRVTLPGDLDLALATPLVENLRHALSRGVRVEVVAEAVERVGSAPIQALMIAAREAEGRGMGFAILSTSEVFTETCDDLGLTAWLEKWSRK